MKTSVQSWRRSRAETAIKVTQAMLDNLRGRILEKI